MKYKKKYFLNSRGELYVPPGVGVICPYEFKEDIKITKVTLSSDVRLIGEGAFFGCSKLKEVVFESNSLCKYIGRGAFYGCFALEQIKLPIGLQRIGELAFYLCASLKRVVVSPAIKLIEVCAFACCYSLQEVALGAFGVSVCTGAFGHCSQLHKLVIGDKQYKILYLKSSVMIVEPFSIIENIKIDRCQRIDYIDKGQIRGDLYFHTFCDNGDFEATSMRLREAISETIYKRNHNIQKRFYENNWTMDSLMSPEDYRIITGACKDGFEKAIKKEGYKNSDRATIREVLEWTKKEPLYPVFLEFAEKLPGFNKIGETNENQK